MTKWEFRQVDESLAAAVRSMKGQWLGHVVSLQPSLLHTLLHQFHSLHASLWVKVAVNANNISTYREDVQNRSELRQ